MGTLYFCCLTVLFAISPLQASTVGRVRLKVEQTTTLYVGQTAVLRLPKGFVVHGAAGNALIPLEQAHQKARILYFYRAAQQGYETIITDSPAEMEKRHCIDCAVQHYFITVLPMKAK